MHEENDALRSHTTLLPWCGRESRWTAGRRGSSEAAAVGYVAAGVPLLGAPSLADSSAEVIDGSTVPLPPTARPGSQEEDVMTKEDFSKFEKMVMPPPHKKEEKKKTQGRGALASMPKRKKT